MAEKKKKFYEPSEEEVTEREKLWALYENAKTKAQEQTSRFDEYDDWYNGTSSSGKKLPYKSNCKVNFVFTTIESILPIMTDVKPQTFFSTPNEDMEEYTEAVKQYEKVHGYVNEEVIDLDGNLPLVYKDTLKYGTGIVKVPWNQNKNNGLGDVVLEIKDPRNFYPDPRADEIEDARFVFLDEYTNTLGLKLDNPKFAHLINVDQEIDGEEVTLVVEGWIKDKTPAESSEDIDENESRKLKFPGGKVVLMTNSCIFKEETNPYKDNEFPFVKFIDIPVRGSFWGMGEVAQLIDPQKAFDTVLNGILDSVLLMGNPIWIVDKQSGVKPKQLSNRPGLVVVKQVNTRVEREMPPPLPRHLFELLFQLKEAIEIVSGVHDVSQGRRPVGVEAASAIMTLQDAAQTRIREKMRSMEKSLRRLTKMVFARIRQYYTEEQILPIVGHNGIEMFKFEGSDGFETPSDYVVNIDSNSTLAMTRLGLYEQAKELYGMDAIDQEALLECSRFPRYKEIMARMEEQAPPSMPPMGGGMPPLPLGGMPPMPMGEAPMMPMGEMPMPTGEMPPTEGMPMNPDELLPPM